MVPFAVAMPNVQFPPGQDAPSVCDEQESRDNLVQSKHVYRYAALITFSGGRLVEVPAGYTTFHPAPPPSVPVHHMSSTNVTFSHEGWGTCAMTGLPMNVLRPMYTARVDLENGGVVHAGIFHPRCRLITDLS